MAKSKKTPVPPRASRGGSPPVLSVRLRVQRGDEIALGPGKVELLAAIAATGSITAAAKRLGISYMHSWNLIQAMNQSFRAPLVFSSRGGQKGGGAGLTPEGKKVLSIYQEMATESLRAAQNAWERLRPTLHGAKKTTSPGPLALSPAEEDDDDLMAQSIRNELPGTVKEIISDKVLSEVIVETALGEIAAVVTTRSVRDMKLKVGDPVAALVKATNVSVRRQD